MHRKQWTTASTLILSRTILGVKCKDGVILAAEKMLTSKLLVHGTNHRVFPIDNKIGMVEFLKDL
jgi:20S proteasome subunit alpha 7